MPKTMSNQPQKKISRPALNREKVLRAAIAIADRDGIDGLSMRKLGEELNVEAMSIYNYIANKEELLDAMSDYIVNTFDRPDTNLDWKSALRQCTLSAHKTLWLHPWLCALSMSRPKISTASLEYAESITGVMRSAEFSNQLIHHALHAIDNHLFGSTLQELSLITGMKTSSPEINAIFLQQMLDKYPNISHVIVDAVHDHEVEFVFVLDLLLDGLERMRRVQTP
jgi:AcrR family transcriptional regulator